MRYILLIIVWILSWQQITKVTNLNGIVFSITEMKSKQFDTRGEALSCIANEFDSWSSDIKLEVKE